MFQDHRENIWFGGEGAFAKFNGREIWHYTLEGMNKDVYAIIQEDNGNLWFGSNGGGIIKYDGRHFLKVQFPDSTLNSQAIGILDVVKDDDGYLLFASTKFGIFSIKDDQFAAFSTDQGLAHRTTMRLHIDPSNRLWVGYWNKGVSVLEYGLWNHCSVDSGLAYELVNSIDDGLNGKVHVSTRNGTSIVNFESGKFEIRNVLAGRDIAQTATDRNDRIWFAVKRNEGCYVMEGDSIYQFSTEQGLVQERALCFLRDSRDNMWIGSFGKGASVYGVDLFEHFNESTGLESGRSYGIYEDAELGLLIGGHGGMHTLVDGKFQKLDFFPSLEDVEIYDIYRDEFGDLWVAAAGQGIFRQRTNGDVDFYPIPRGQTNWIFDMGEGGDGQMYFVGYTGLMTLKEDTLVHVELNGLPVNHQMWVIQKDPDGNLWMGSENSGLVAWTFDSNTRTYADSLVVFGQESGIGKTASGIRVMDLLLDDQDNIWLTLRPGGLYRTSHSGLLTAIGAGRIDSLDWHVMSVEQGLPGRWASSLVLEAPGRLWAGTNAGLALIEISGRDTTIRHYGDEFGLLSTQIVHNNALVDSQGDIWWSSENFVVKYNPDLDYRDTIQPKVQIEDVSINAEIIDYNAPDEVHPIDTDLSFFEAYLGGYIHYSGVIPWTNMPDELVLSYDQNNLAFNFSAPVWDRPERTRYEAMLEGRDEFWSEVGSSELYRCFHLNPGDYILKIRAINADGVHSEAAEYAFTIMPPFWKTKGFYGIILLIVAAGVLVYIRRRVKALKKENIKLENAVLRRTEELRRSKKKSDDLLLNILPEFTAEELKETGKAQTRGFDSASVLFSDFEGFTKLTQTIDSQELVESLDEFFKAYDELGQKYQIEKIKTIGDAYMCASGIPVEDPFHALKIVAFGLEMLDRTTAINERRKNQGKSVWNIRIGVHSGPLIAGVVGQKKFAFDIWGDTVNTAARMEQNGVNGMINVSEATFNSVSDVFEGESRGEQEVKGKGKVKMHLIKGFKPEFAQNGDRLIAGPKFLQLITTSEAVE